MRSYRAASLFKNFSATKMIHLFKAVLFLSEHDDPVSLFMMEFRSKFVGVTSDLLSFGKARLKK